MQDFSMDDERLAHLPLHKRRELQRVASIVFEEFEDALKTKLSDKDRRGRILKLILYGSHARGDWVEDRGSGYYSDYDILVVVNSARFAEEHDVWHKVDDRFIQDLQVTRRLKTQPSVIVHAYDQLNSELAQGRPFFVDVARDGIALYEAAGYPLAEPKLLAPEEIASEARLHFDNWFPLAQHALKLSRDSVADGVVRDAAFMLHQATERLYNCVLLVFTLYSPASHNLTFLRSQSEDIAPRLIEVWPRNTKHSRRCFSLLKRAYVEARYSLHYKITTEELAWLTERVAHLRDVVEEVCRERLGETPS